MTELWAVWSFHEGRDGVRREYVEAICATHELAIAEAGRMFRVEVDDLALPHDERAKLFIRPVRVLMKGL